MIRYLGNMVFGLGGTQELSLPMMTVLRRLALFAILNFLNLFFNQVLDTHDHDRRVLHLKGSLIFVETKTHCLYCLIAKLASDGLTSFPCNSCY